MLTMPPLSHSWNPTEFAFFDTAFLFDFISFAHLMKYVAHLFFYDIGFFFCSSSACVPHNLHPAEELGVWTIREQKINASTAVWHFTGARLSHIERNPKDSFKLRLLGLKERGLKADKREGLQGFFSWFVLVIQITCLNNFVWAVEHKEAQK